MPRSLVLGNGTILVGFDAYARVRDFYFPYIGVENHVGSDDVHNIGVRVDGQFSWLGEHDWRVETNCEWESFSGNTEAQNDHLRVRLEFKDVVYNEKNIFLRQVTLHNLAAEERSFKIFFNQQFELYESHRGDTAYFDPRDHVVIHYKGRRAFLINAIAGNKEPFDDYSTGDLHIKGREGTYKDAEDGVLEKNSIAHGKVDSVIGLSLTCKAGERAVVYYWVAVGKSIQETKDLNNYVLAKSPPHLLKTTQDFWHAWVNRYEFVFHGLDDSLVELFKKSLFFIRAHADNHGAIVASSDSDMLQYGLDTYGYMWPRDGALSAMALDQAGDFNVAKRFFEFCNSVIADQGYFMHKYRPDGSLGSSWHPWVREGKAVLPIQEDETALVIYALWRHYELSKDLEFIESLYNSLIKKAADFLELYRDKHTGLPKASYDLWEEQFGVFTFTSSAVYAALLAAANFANLLGKFDEKDRYAKAADEVKAGILRHLYNADGGGFYKKIEITQEGKIISDTTIDMSSIYGIFAFGVLDANDERVKTNIRLVEERLLCKTEVGGVPRHEGDRYYSVNDNAPSNPWFITTLWLAQYYLATAKQESDLEIAKHWLAWVGRYALSSGILSEQVNPYTGEQLSASPLTWSHSEFVLTIVKYLETLDRLGICVTCNPLHAPKNRV